MGNLKGKDLRKELDRVKAEFHRAAKDPELIVGPTTEREWLAHTIKRYLDDNYSISAHKMSDDSAIAVVKSELFRLVSGYIDWEKDRDLIQAELREAFFWWGTKISKKREGCTECAARPTLYEELKEMGML